MSGRVPFHDTWDALPGMDQTDYRPTGPSDATVVNLLTEGEERAYWQGYRQAQMDAVAGSPVNLSLREALISALRQWEMYSDEGRGDVGTFGYIEESTDPNDMEAAKYRDCVTALWPAGDKA